MIGFKLYTDLTIGNGTVRQLDQFIQNKGYRQPAFLVDEGFARSALWTEVLQKAGRAFGEPVQVILSRGTAEPTYDYVDEVVEGFRRLEFDVLVGIGGGSCLDVAKVAAALKVNPGPAMDYRGFDKVTQPGRPTILIPTTAGTGSEVTINASFVDSASKRKLGVNGRYIHGTYAILDGETTLSCPYNAALSAGIDAMVHTLESFAAKQHNRITRFYAREAFRLLSGALPALKSDSDNVAKRLDLLLGAYYAGISLFNSGSGIAGGLSYPLGVHHRVPHGICGGIFCLQVVAYNIAHGYYDYAELDGVEADPKTGATRLLHRLETLFTELGVPKNLSGFGLGPEMYPNVLEICQGLQPAFDQNPVPFSVQNDLPSFLKSYF
jgi:alcohol dehydrogenase